MAIGDIKAVANITPYSQQTVDPNAFGAGIAQALDGLARSTQNYEESKALLSRQMLERQNKQDDFETARRYTQFIGEENRAQAEILRSAPADGRGVTNITDEQAAKRANDFLSTVPERLKGEYSVKLEGFKQDSITRAFNFEYQAGTEFFKTGVNNTVNEQASMILSGETTAEQARATVGELIAKSDLPAADKEALSTQAESFIAKAEFQKDLERAKIGKGTVGPADGKDVVAAGLKPYERGVLNAISSVESPGYNVRYGGVGSSGKTFDSYADHPRIYEKRPDGRVSSAAGRYQFTASTWDWVAKEAGLTDFSPESQDRGAIWLARHIYNSQLVAGEMTFDQVLASGNRTLIENMPKMLTDATGGWEGFRHMSGKEFYNKVMGVTGVAGGGTGSPQMPNVWTDERFAGMSYDDKLRAAALADQQAAAIAKQESDAAKAKHEALYQDAMQKALDGQLTDKDEYALREAGALTKASEIKAYRENVKIGQDTVARMSRVVDALSNGGFISREDNSALNKLVGQEGLQKLGNMDTEYLQNDLLPLAYRAGYFPSDSAKMLTDMMHKGGREGDFAMQILQNAYSANPNMIAASGISESDQKQIAMSATLSEYYNPEQVREKIARATDPTLAASNKAIETEAQKAFAKITNESLLDQFDPGMFTRQPDAPVVSSQVDAFRSDMSLLFTEGYKLTGDKDQALQYATKQMQQHWGTTTLGSPEPLKGKITGIEHSRPAHLAKYSPEKFYPAVEGSYDWIDQQVRSTLSIPADKEYRLVADNRTVAEASSYAQTGKGHNASYEVYVKDENGLWNPERNAEGLKQRVAFEITSEMRDRAVQKNRYEGLLAERDAILELGQSGGALPPGTAEKLKDIMGQIDEMRGRDKLKDPSKIGTPAELDMNVAP